MTQADLGLADAYINGDFSFVDKDEGLLNLILVSILIWIFQWVVSLGLYTSIYHGIFTADSHSQQRFKCIQLKTEEE